MKKFKFSFECDENPMKMGEVGNTRHCTKCERNIVDFTKFTPQQITEYIKNNKKPCGFMFPWQVDQVNNYIEQSSCNSSPLYKIAKVAAIISSPLLFTPSFGQKTANNIEISSVVRNSTNVITEVVLRDMNDEPIALIDIEIYSGTILIGTTKTDETGKMSFDHSQFEGKSVLKLKNKELGIEKEISLKHDALCVIWKTNFLKNEKIIELNKFDLQFVYSDENEKPIRHTKVEVLLYDTSNVLIETIEIKSNMSGYSYFKTKYFGKIGYVSFTLYTKHGLKTAYTNVMDLHKTEINKVRVNKKYRTHMAGIMINLDSKIKF